MKNTFLPLYANLSPYICWTISCDDPYSHEQVFSNDSGFYSASKSKCFNQCFLLRQGKLYTQDLGVISFFILQKVVQ